jgi:hypothetical protein
LLAGCIPLMAIAGLLEAGVARAPDWFLSSGLKLAVAGVFGSLFVAYVLLLGWNFWRPAAREQPPLPTREILQDHQRLTAAG